MSREAECERVQTCRLPGARTTAVRERVPVTAVVIHTICVNRGTSASEVLPLAVAVVPLVCEGNHERNALYSYIMYALVVMWYSAPESGDRAHLAAAADTYRVIDECKQSLHPFGSIYFYLYQAPGMSPVVAYVHVRYSST